MKTEIEISIIDAFTDTAFQGNPACVIFSDKLSKKTKQLIAKEINLSETAFIGSSKTSDFSLNWFTPSTEVKLCGHATIAALHYLFENALIKGEDYITFETLSGIIKCYVQGNQYFMQIPLPKLKVYSGNLDQVLNIMQIEKSDIADLPIIILDTGYLFIPVKSRSILYKITPDMNQLKNICSSKKGFFDVAVFTTDTFDPKSSAHLRFFAPYHGINEDPVTGSACGPLLLVLLKLGQIKNYSDNQLVIIEQGDFLKRKGRVMTKFDSKKKELFISGNAITVLKGKMYF